jgi:hypothetical protein
VSSKCADICGVSLQVEPKSAEDELLRDIYSAHKRLGPPGSCYVICVNIMALCAVVSNCKEAAKEFVKRYRKIAEIFRDEVLRIAALL